MASTRILFFPLLALVLGFRRERGRETWPQSFIESPPISPTRPVSTCPVRKQQFKIEFTDINIITDSSKHVDVMHFRSSWRILGCRSARRDGTVLSAKVWILRRHSQTCPMSSSHLRTSSGRLPQSDTAKLRRLVFAAIPNDLIQPHDVATSPIGVDEKAHRPLKGHEAQTRHKKNISDGHWKKCAGEKKDGWPMMDL